MHRNIITLFYDGTPSAKKSLRIAMSLANKDGSELFVLITDKEFEKVINECLKEQIIKSVIQVIDNQDMLTILADLKKYSPKLLIIPESSQLIENTDYLHRVVEKLECDVMLVR